MARKLRIEYPGAVYHVMSRGDHQDLIFTDDHDRKTFLNTLTEACEKTGWIVHAYVLMGNHYHLLLETPEANLASGMKWLQGTYTQRFNSRHKVHGHLFQGRYKALNIDDDDGYLLTVSTYIHLNPVRARLVGCEPGQLQQFAWSSFPAYIGPPNKRPNWLETKRVFGGMGLGPDSSRIRRRYAAWVDARALECSVKPPEELEAAWQEIRRGWYLGGETFRDQLLDWISKTKRNELKRDSLGGDAIRTHDEAGAGRLLKEGMDRLKVSGSQLQVQTNKGSPEKLVLAWWIRKQTTISRHWIAERLHMGHPSRVTAAVRAVTEAQPRSQLAKLKSAVSGNRP